MAIFSAAAVPVEKKSVALHLYTENSEGSSFFVYEQYVNQHKLENPECSEGKLSLSIHFLFSYTELFACHHKNHITAVIASFRKAFSLWVKAHKSQSIDHNRDQVGRLVCSGSQGDLRGADGIDCGWKLPWKTPPHLMPLCIERETRSCKREFNPQMVEWHWLNSARKLFLAPQNSQNRKWIQPASLVAFILQSQVFRLWCGFVFWCFFIFLFMQYPQG